MHHVNVPGTGPVCQCIFPGIVAGNKRSQSVEPRSAQGSPRPGLLVLVSSPPGLQCSGACPPVTVSLPVVSGQADQRGRLPDFVLRMSEELLLSQMSELEHSLAWVSSVLALLRILILQR